MDLPDSIPATLQQFFAQNYPPLTGLERLGGVSGSGAWRATFGNISVVLKSNTQPQESDFYQYIAPALRQQGVAIPALYFTAEGEDGAHWLTLENLPRPLPRERWGADPEILAILGNLHRAKLPSNLALTALYRPAWNDAMTANALKVLDLDSARLAPVLQEWQQQAQALFRAVGFISADPNPGNWGLREDGSAGLFDWERFSVGSPAIDVAIITTGLPGKERLHYNAAKYLAANPNVINQSLDEFANAVKLAKIWSVVEFIYTYATQPDNGIPADTINWLHQDGPGWLDSLV